MRFSFEIYEDCPGKMKMLEKTGSIIKSLFIEEVEEPAASASPDPSMTQNSSPQSDPPPDSFSQNDLKKMMDRLSNTIASKNQEGFDYLEYRNAIKELILNGQTESTAFTTVFTTAKTIGVTKQTLVDSANYYLSILDSEYKEFNDELNSRKNSDIVEKENAVKKIGSEIEKLIKEKEKLEKEILKSKDKIEGAGTAFISAYKNINSKIKEDIQKLDKYIK